MSLFGGGTCPASSLNLVNQCLQSIEEITEEAVEITDEEDVPGEVEENDEEPEGKIEAVNEGRDDGVADNEDVSEMELRLKARLKVLLYK